MNYISAFFSYWLSPLYFFAALLFGLASFFSMPSSKENDIKILARAKLRPARFIAATIFILLSLVALYVSYSALVFQHYLMLKKIHP